MFDDFDTMQQVDEIIPEEYDDWCRWVYGGAYREEALNSLIGEQRDK